MPAKRKQSRQIVFTAVTMCSAALALAACSSSGSSSTSSAPASAAASAGASSGASSQASGTATGSSQINQYLAKYSGQAPIALAPLASKPAAGKKVIILTNSASPGDILDGKAFIAATKVLGWNGTTIDYAGDPASLATAFQQAISDKPAAIEVDGQTVSVFAASLKAATAAGIPVFELGTPTVATGMAAGGLTGVELGPKFIAAEGQIAADWILKDSGGHANVAIVTLPSLYVLVYSDNAFIAELHKRCPTCKTTVVNQQFSDIGQSLPATVTSTLQSNPSYNYVFFPYGDTSVGVPAALKAASIKVKIVTTTANANEYAEIKTGAIVMGVSSSPEVQGWSMADAMARYFETNKPVNDDWPPVQIFTSANDSSPTLPVSPSDYQSQFEKLWHIS